jgi:short-subunit dehydrogenase
MRVLILGATSAIAAEAAVIYAERGDRLHLVGRDAQKLASLAARCAGTTVTTEQADFSALDRNEAVVRAAMASLGQIDLVLIAHGDLGDQLASEREFGQAEATLRINFTSVVSLLIPLANALEAARSGRIGVITSVAGERGRPRNYTYGAAKGAERLSARPAHAALPFLRQRHHPQGRSGRHANDPGSREAHAIRQAEIRRPQHRERDRRGRR